MVSDLIHNFYKLAKTADQIKELNISNISNISNNDNQIKKPFIYDTTKQIF
jgi:hypothetical protein